MLLWPLSILLRVALHKPDAMQFHSCKIDNKTQKTHLTFTLDMGNTVLDIKDEQMQEILTLWCLTKTSEQEDKTLKLRYAEKEIKIEITDRQTL